MSQRILSQVLGWEFFWQGVLPLVLWLLAYYGIRALLWYWGRSRDIASSWFRAWRYLAILFYALAIYQPVRLLFPQLERSLQNFGSFFTSPLMGKEGAPSLLVLLALVPIFLVASQLATACVKILGLYFERSKRISKRFYKSNVQALLTLSQYLLILLFSLFGINLLGLNLTSLGVLLGALGLGVGFGLQNMAANFFSGITLLITGHIQHGDFIRSKGVLGTVDRIGLLSTVLLTTEYQNLIIPNQALLNEIIENASYNNNRQVQLHLPVSISYRSKLHQVIELLYDILAKNPYQPPVAPAAGEPEHADVGVSDSQQKAPERDCVHTAPAEQKAGKTGPSAAKQPQQVQTSSQTATTNHVWISGFGESAIDLEVRMMIANIDSYRLARHWFYLTVWECFRQHEVEIPFPQRDLHLRDLPPQADRPVSGFGL